MNLLPITRDPVHHTVRLTLLGRIPVGPRITAERFAWSRDQIYPRWLRRWRQCRWGRELSWPVAAIAWLRGEGG